MWFGKLSLKAAALVLFGAVSSMAAETAVAPMTFGDSKTDVNNWNYLTQYKLWGTNGIELGNRPGFYNPNYFNKETGVMTYPANFPLLDSLGAVGTNKTLSSVGDGGWLDGPVVVGGNITNKGQNFEILTGPIRTNGSNAAIVRDGVLSCRLDNTTGNCSPAKVPDYRSAIKVPTLTGSITWRSAITVPNSKRYTIDVNSMCSGTGTCDIYYEAINFENDGRLVVSMPDDGRTTRIFTKSLNMNTHPQIVVRYPSKGDLKANEYEGNLLIYVNGDITFVNTDNADMMGTLVSNGTIEMRCNMTVAGQFIANKIIIGNEIEAKKFTFKPFNKVPELVVGNNSKKITENDKWYDLDIVLNGDEPATEKVTFDYCFEFQSASGVQNTYAGYQDVGAADDSHKFPICNKGEVGKGEIPVGETKAKGIGIKPLLDGLVEEDEALWFQLKNIQGAKTSSDYEDGKGYKIYIVSKDVAPSVSSLLVIKVNEDSKYTFSKNDSKNEFKFQHATQSFAAVIITSLPTAGTLTLDGKAVTRDQKIVVGDLGKLVYTPKADEFGNKYATFGYKVVGDGTGTNTSGPDPYTATINVVPVNDAPTVSTNNSNEVVFTVMEKGDLAGGKITVGDVSNERNVDTYTYNLVNVSGSDYDAFKKAFTIVKDGDQNATLKVNSGVTLNYATKKKYVVYAKISDNAATETETVTGGGTKESKQFIIVVNIKNENDAPTISAQTFTKPEKKSDGSDWPNGESVGKVTTASDPDGDQLTFTAPSNVPFKFKDGTNELVITDGSQLDYETKPTWTFKVTVTDGDLSASANITVNLTDVNEPPPPPIVDKNYYIDENSDKGTALGTFKVTDADKISGSYETLTYEISGALTGAANTNKTLTNKSLKDLFTLTQKSVNSSTGERTVAIVVNNKALLDYEELYKTSTGNATYVATIKVTDTKGHSVSKTTNITIRDVNESLTATGGTFYLQEHSPGASYVCATGYDTDGSCKNDKYGQVVGNDKDKYNPAFRKFTYKMSSANANNTKNAKDAKKFTVDSQGFIKTANDAEFDYEEGQKSYEFYVTISDGEFSDDAKVTVVIEDVEEPTINLIAEGEDDINENDQGATVEFSADKITDPVMKQQFEDIGDILFYELADGTSDDIKGIFFVNVEDGSIVVDDVTKLNYEALSYEKDKNKFLVKLKVTGTKGTLDITRTIVVMDVNEKPVSKNQTFTVPETLESLGKVGTLWATDPDSCSVTKPCRNGTHPSRYNKLSYSIVDDENVPFDIDPNTGVITLKNGAKLRYKEKKKYQFEVKISDRSLDKKSGPLTTYATVTVNVTDENEPSEFRVLSSLYEVNEMVPLKTQLDDKIVVFDDDDADVDALTITIEDNATAASLFEVVQVGKTKDNESTFAIQVKKDIDYEKLYDEVEKNADFEVTLTIKDSRGKNPVSKQTVIRVNDVNEEPAFTEDSYAFEISESTTKPTAIGVAEAKDPDIYNPKFGTKYFSLEGDDAAPFDVDVSTGEISIIKTSELDHETKPVYKFTVIVTDKEYTASVPVTVNILDAPEGPVFPDPPPAMDVDENSKKGTKVGEIVASDDDCKNKRPCKTPTYKLIESEIAPDDYTAFVIDNNGVITVAADNSLNFEKQSEYLVRVVATDGANKDLTDTAELTILINDVNDAPTYEQKEYVFEIHESAKKGEFVGSVVADDEDAWTKLSYALSDYVDKSGDKASFTIDGSGKITLTAGSLNYEKKKLYQVWATATDNGEAYGKKIGRTDFKNYEASTLVTINLINDPDPPVIHDDDEEGYDVEENTIDKNSPTGKEIACYDVEDEDEGQVATLVPYVTDVGETDADRLFDAKLKKDGSKYKLCLIVKNGDRLNYETIAHTHKVKVFVMDGDQLTDYVAKTINIVDVNEMPVISSTPSLSFYENKGENYVIGKLLSDDIDTSKAFTNNVFKAIGGDTDLFTITEDGKLKAKRDFDYETEKRHTFELEISLSDKDSKKYPKLTTSTTVSITLKDMPEFPEITSTEFDVDENSEGGTPIGVLEAVDPDGDTEFLFALAEDNPYVSVYSTGEIKVLPDAKIDYEKTQKFTILVSVTDMDGMSSEKEIVIKVNDLNEAPKIKPQEFTFPEDSKPGTKKGPVKADDPDTKNPKFNDLKFYPVEENDKFEIKPNGDIVLKSELDYEKEKSYVVKVYVTDGEFNDTTDVTIKVGNVVEKAEVEITRVETGKSVYIKPTPKDTIFTNKDLVSVEWKQEGKTKSSIDTLKSEGCHEIVKTYKDPSKDLAGSDSVVVCYSTAAPIVDIGAKKTTVEADNIYTIVEKVDKKDSTIYVNSKSKDVQVSVQDSASGIKNSKSTVEVKLDTVAISDKTIKNMVDVSKSEIALEKNPKTDVYETPIGDKTKISYDKVVDGDTVTVSYLVDEDGDIVKTTVYDENGKKKTIEVIEVSTVIEVKGKEVTVSYKADAETGNILYGDSEGNLMFDTPKSSSSKDSKDNSAVDLKTGVGAFTVTYDAQGVEGNKTTVSYVVDEKGKIVANEEGDRGYLVTYTYTNKYGNSAEKSVFMVLDRIAPKVIIRSPKKDAVVYANYVDVDWCIAYDGDEDNCVTQDTLNFQSLNKGMNTIKRIYRDKAGNETVTEVSVLMKKAKDVDIELEKPMVLVSIDSVNKYYDINPPEKDQTFAVSILNPSTQKEMEVIKGFSDDNKKGSGDEPYPGYDGHLGPTIDIKMKLPLVSAVGGLSTLDDIIINGNMVPLDGVDADNSPNKVSVEKYVEKYCSTEFQTELEKNHNDYSKANLYSTKAHVTLWFYTTGGQFVDKYSFDYKINDPDYVDKSGLVKFFFEMKPDMNGELRDADGRLYGTGPYIVKTEVELRSKLRCVVPPVDGNAKIGDVLKSSDEMMKRFGYRRPVVRGNEKSSSSKKDSKKGSSSKKKK